MCALLARATNSSLPGIASVVVQRGRGEYVPFQTYTGSLTTEHYGLKPSLDADMRQASLVITHAGYGCTRPGGTIFVGLCSLCAPGLMEALTLGKRVVAVVNEALMDNHQEDIATELARQRLAVACTPETLLEALVRTDWTLLRPLPPASPGAYAQRIDQLMGVHP